MLGGLHQWQNQPDPTPVCCSDAVVRNKTFNQFENTNYAHQWTPCMEGSIFFAPTSQSTNLYILIYSSVGKLLQAWPLVACLYSKPKTMNRFSSPRCMLLIQAIQVWDKKRVEWFCGKTGNIWLAGGQATQFYILLFSADEFFTTLPGSANCTILRNWGKCPLNLPWWRWRWHAEAKSKLKALC